MHDLDRSDLVFESDGFDAGLEELDDSELEPDASEGVFDGIEQSELAGELLGVTSDNELDHFLGSLIKNAARKLGPIGGGLAKNLGGLLKGAIKTSLPTLATVAGGALGGPAGAMIASRATPYLSSMLGMELEGLSAEDQEFEAAKQLVRLAGSAIEKAVNAAGNGGSPGDVARQAVIDAARQYAPGLVQSAGRAVAGRNGGRAQSGTWYRRGNRIVIVGV
ncbi:MAG TPA: hypothetical protein VFQ53_26390 [Kofleriaceae bacterium]|nr:hypothetical protein [Kofleriaceae bacterium]